MSTRPHTRSFRRLALVAAAAVAACSVAPSPAQEKKKNPAEAMKALEQMLNDYRDENATLRERVKELEGQVATLKQNRVVNIVPQPGAANQVPPNWKPFQFNGGTYYIVPLKAGKAQAYGELRTTARETATKAATGDQPANPTIVLPAPKK